jgi:hypothetical protein
MLIRFKKLIGVQAKSIRTAPFTMCDMFKIVLLRKNATSLVDSAKDDSIIAKKVGNSIQVVHTDRSEQKNPVITTLNLSRKHLSFYLRTVFHSLFWDQDPEFQSVQVFALGQPTILVSLETLKNNAELRDVVYDMALMTEESWFA